MNLSFGGKMQVTGNIRNVDLSPRHFFFQLGFFSKASKQTSLQASKRTRCFFKAMVLKLYTVLSMMYFQYNPCSSNAICKGPKNPRLVTLAKLYLVLCWLLQNDKVIGVITKHDKRILVSNCLVRHLEI